MAIKLSTLAVTVAVALATVTGATSAQAGTLENLERERALLIQTFLDPALTPEQRQSTITSANRRLVDLERMVLRDKQLRKRQDRIVRRAFKNYDVTFIAHASAEKNLTTIDNWLEQFGMTTESLRTAEAGSL